MPLSQIKYLFNIDMIGDNNPVQYCEVSDEEYYHAIFYTYYTVRFDSYEPVFRLVRDFVEQY